MNAQRELSIKPIDYDEEPPQPERTYLIPYVSGFTPRMACLLIWFFIAGTYLFRTPDHIRTHDFEGHIRYTQIVSQEHRLPRPYEMIEACQPPLYYALNSLLLPGSRFHVKIVRSFSLLYGALALVLMLSLLNDFKIHPALQVLAVGFVASTPKYVMLFTTYNNDALIAVLSMTTFLVFLRLRQRWTWTKALLLGSLVVLSLYTKHTVFFLLIPLFLILLYDYVGNPLRRRTALRTGLVCALACLSIGPWVFLRSYPQTGQLFPNNFHTLGSFMRIDGSPLRILAPPLTVFEWDDPSVYGRTMTVPSPRAGNFWAFFFTTSVVGEYIYTVPRVSVVWFLLGLHLTVSGAALWAILTHPEARIPGFAALAGVLLLALMTLKAPFSPHMDFRHVAWVSLPFALLLACALQSSLPSPALGRTLVRSMEAGIAVHIFFLFVAESVF